LMVGRRSPQSPSISRLTLQPETIPSCYRRSRHTEFQPHSGRHRKECQRYCHIDLPHAAFFAGGDLFDVGYRASADLIEPTPATRDGRHKRDARLKSNWADKRLSQI
jgi:hypothetical protein